MTKRKYRTHLVITDPQVKKGVPLKHLQAARNFISEERPDVVVHIGDHWDMPSLSSYSSKLEAEGKRYKDDVDAGNEGMDILSANWGYKPEKHFTIGNHEERIARAIKDYPHLSGQIGYHDLNLKGWKVHDYLTPVTIDGVSYCHYFYSPMSGKPIGGDARAMLNKIGFSFVQGHRQELSYARKELANGSVIHGLVAGAFHMHDESYKGPQAADHWRGICRLHNVRDGNYDLEVISLARLLKEYS